MSSGKVLFVHLVLNKLCSSVIFFDRLIFGMGKVAFKQMLDMTAPALRRTREGENPTVLPAMHRFVVFLQFLRTNEFQRAVGTQFFLRVSQSLVSKTVKEVAEIMAAKVPEVSS
jgi:hypothetical protein